MSRPRRDCWQYRNLTAEMSALAYRPGSRAAWCGKPPRFIPALVAGLRDGQGYRPDQLADAAGLLPDEFARFYLRSGDPDIPPDARR